MITDDYLNNKMEEIMRKKSQNAVSQNEHDAFKIFHQQHSKQGQTKCS